MQMSIKKYANVQKVFDEIILEYGIANGYKGLADWLGVPYQTLLAVFSIHVFLHKKPRFWPGHNPVRG